MIYVYLCLFLCAYTKMYMQVSDLRPASNRRPVLQSMSISTSQISVAQIYVLFQILKSVSNSQIYGGFSLSQIDVTDVYGNPNQ